MTLPDPTNSTTRFSDRVDNYVKYRPSYPNEIIPFLKQEIDLDESTVIADIGSGTGILTELFLKNGNAVYGIEPNLEMRMAAEKNLNEYEKFSNIQATAEKTSLKERSIDIITVGQAFHWFDKEKSSLEFKRILKPDGYVVLIWNTRLTDTTLFLRDYEKMLCQFGTDYSEVSQSYSVDKTTQNLLFSSGLCSLKSFQNMQIFDFEGLKGRLLSSSYAPNTGNKNYEPMINELSRIFERHNKEGQVVFEYNTQVYFGRVCY